MTCHKYGKLSYDSKVLISKPRTMEELKQRIKEEIAAIPKQMTQVMENPQGR
jgi:hypothetical protein